MTDRGIIVVDASSLMRLQADVEQSLQNGRTNGKSVHHYVDLLAFLGENGFRIIIPEMVAVETAGVLKDAPKSVSYLFRDSNWSKSSGQAREIVKNFLERVKTGNVPGVEILLSEADTEQEQYLNSLRKIAGDRFLPEPKKRKQLIAAQKNDQPHFGEAACLDSIKTLLNTSTQPVYFLSDDYESLKDCEELFPGQVNRLNARGFLGGFIRSPISNRLQLKRRMLDDVSNGINGLNTMLIDNGRARQEGSNYPFLRQMEDLAKELMAPPANTLAKETNTAVPTTDTAHELGAALPDHAVEIINTKPQRKKLMELESTPSTSNNTAYEEYKQSFGGQVYIRRNERNMSPKTLADAVIEVSKGGALVNEDVVMDWEFGEKVPDRDQFNALVSLLIEKNDAIPHDMKSEEAEAFAVAYKRSKGLIEASENTPADPETRRMRQAFGRMLRKLEGSLAITPVEFAQKVTEGTKITLTETEQDLLMQEPVPFIGAVEAGAVNPSKGLAVAIVSALDKAADLTEEHKRELYAAYEATSASEPENVSYASAVNRKPRRAIDSEKEPASPEALAIRSKLVDLFREENGKANTKAITAYARDTLGFERGTPSPIYRFLNEDEKSVGAIKNGLSSTIKDMLEAYLIEHSTAANDAEKEAEKKHLNSIFDELRQAIGHRTRSR